jgi:hypothetical protein
MAKASPDKDMILIDCPNNFRNSTPEIMDMGIVMMTISAARRSFKNNITINPVRRAPRTPLSLNFLKHLKYKLTGQIHKIFLHHQAYFAGSSVKILSVYSRLPG